MRFASQTAVVGDCCTGGLLQYCKHVVSIASEHQFEVIHRFEGNGLKEDWLSSKHKDFLDKYKGGQFVKYPGYEKALESEAALIGNLLASPEEKEYMRRAATYDSWATLIRMSQPQRRLHLAPAPRRLQQVRSSRPLRQRSTRRRRVKVRR